MNYVHLKDGKTSEGSLKDILIRKNPMGKMYFPDEVPNKKTSRAEQHKAYKRELTKVILIWVGVIVLVIIDIILLTKLL